MMNKLLFPSEVNLIIGLRLGTVNTGYRHINTPEIERDHYLTFQK